MIRLLMYVYTLFFSSRRRRNAKVVECGTKGEIHYGEAIWDNGSTPHVVMIQNTKDKEIWGLHVGNS